VGDNRGAGDPARHPGQCGAVQPIPAAGVTRLHRPYAALHALTQRKPGIVELSEYAGVSIARGEKHCNDQKYGN